MRWKDMVDFWNRLNKEPEEPKQEEEPQNFNYFRGYIDNIKTELSEADKKELLKQSFQKEPPIRIAMDAMNDYADQMYMKGLGNTIPDIIYLHFARQGFIGFPACAILKQNWIINNACNVPAQDAIRPGYSLSIKGEDQTHMDKIDDFISLSVKKYHILDICAKAVEMKKVFGSCLVVPTFKGNYDYSVPFNIDSVRPNSYTGMVVIEPTWLQFDFEQQDINNPLSHNFYNPTWFRMPNGIRIHRSHAIWLKNTIVPDVLKPTYSYGGIPLTQMIFQRVWAAEKVANEAPMLALSKRLLVADMNLFSFNGQQGINKEEVDRIIHLRDNFGIVVKQPDANLNQIDTSLSEFDKVLMSQYQLVAAVAQMPATKLLKAQPSGMNATGEYDFKDYSLTLQTIQDNDMKPIVDRHNEILSKSLYDEKIDFTTNFNPIDVPTEQEQALTNANNANILATLVSNGIISLDEARDVLRSNEDSGFNSLSKNNIISEP